MDWRGELHGPEPDGRYESHNRVTVGDLADLYTGALASDDRRALRNRISRDPEAIALHVAFETMRTAPGELASQPISDSALGRIAVALGLDTLADARQVERPRGAFVMSESSIARARQAAEIDTSVPHSPRVWNYWLGGKDNYEIDRQVGDQIRASTPQIVDLARASRAFLRRAVQHLAGPARVRQFLDIGTGLPTADNTHEVAQRVAPDARIVYADNDPMVLAHARALLHGTPEGATTYIEGDMLRPESVLAAAASTLDFERPIGLILMNILGHVADLDDARAIVRTLVTALPAGSYLIVSDATIVLYRLRSC
jgi:S-adenosyl methyltransferase